MPTRAGGDPGLINLREATHCPAQICHHPRSEPNSDRPEMELEQVRLTDHLSFLGGLSEEPMFQGCEEA